MDTFQDNYKSPNSYECLVYGTKWMQMANNIGNIKLLNEVWHVSWHYDLGAYDFLKD